MFENVKWIFFDVGSTLVNEDAPCELRLRETIKGTSISYEEIYNKMIYFAKQNLKGDTEVLKYYGLTKTPWRKDLEIPYEDTEDTLSYLKSKGYKIGIIANQPLGTKDRLEQYGLMKYIDVVAASAELEMDKPDKGIFLYALNEAQCSASEAVMIGDRLDNDIVPAKELGFNTIWIKQGFAVYQSISDSDAKPDCIVNKLSELKSIF